MPVASVNGVDLYYETSGTGFPLVLAHGYCTSINLWQHQMPLLAPRYRVIAYDARGHGLSSAPAGKEHYTLEHLVADMYALLQHLGITQAYIGGHSMGGATTAGFAARHPEMVKAALICNIDGGQQPSDPVADKEAAEIAVLETYLPPAVDATVIERAVTDAIAESGATSPKDLGRVMKAAMARLAGQAVDGKLVNELVRKKLAGA